MPKAATELSVAQLERILEERITTLNGLKKKRERILKDLENVETQISDLEGPGSPGRKGSGGSPRRPRNAKSLKKTVVELLTKNKKGYALTPLRNKVFATGYKSYSTNFNNVLYQCLYNADDIMHDDKTGLYRMK